MDFSADGRYLIASCEFSGQLVKVDVARERWSASRPARRTGDAAGREALARRQVFYVADMHADGLWEIDAHALQVCGFLPTGAGAHGLYPSRDASCCT